MYAFQILQCVHACRTTSMVGHTTAQPPVATRRHCWAIIASECISCAFLYYPPVFNESCNDECIACEGHSDACICMCSQVSDQEELAKLHECRLKVASMVQDIRRQFDIMA